VAQIAGPLNGGGPILRLDLCRTDGVHQLCLIAAAA
jgi:hypothetical protein